MTDLIGPKPEVDGYRLTPNRINIVYPTRREAEAALLVLQAHSHPDYEHSEVTEFSTEAPKYPTPWYIFGTEVRDGDCRTVLYADSPELAEAIVEAVNVYYGGLGRLRDDSGNPREPRVFDGSEEPPADVKKLRAENGYVLARCPGGGWQWTTERFAGVCISYIGWEWDSGELYGSSAVPLTEIID